jgi:hypothetical protein
LVNPLAPALARKIVRAMRRNLKESCPSAATIAAPKPIKVSKLLALGFNTPT